MMRMRKNKLIGENCNRLFTENIFRKTFTVIPDLKLQAFIGMISDKVGEIKDKNTVEYMQLF